MLFTPLRWSAANIGLERTLERRFGPITDCFSYRAGRKFGGSQLVGSKRHANVSHEIRGRTAKLLLKLANKRCALHVAQTRKLRQRPCLRRILKQGKHRRCKARMTSKSKQPAWRILHFTGEPHPQREHRRGKRIEQRAAAEMVVGSFSTHESNETFELRRSAALPAADRSRVHNQTRRKIAAQQPVVGRRDGEMPALKIQPFAPAHDFADDEIR